MDECPISQFDLNKASLRSLLLACFFGQESRRWREAELLERLAGVGRNVPSPTLLMALCDLQADLEADSDQPFTLVQFATDWILRPKNEHFRLLASPRRLSTSIPLGADDLAVLVMIICYRIKGGVTQTAISNVFGRDVSTHLELLVVERLIYADPDRHYDYWKPTRKVLEQLGYSRFEDIPGVVQFGRYIEKLDDESNRQVAIGEAEGILERERRKRSRYLARAASVVGT